MVNKKSQENRIHSSKERKWRVGNQKGVLEYLKSVEPQKSDVPPKRKQHRLLLQFPGQGRE